MTPFVIASSLALVGPMAMAQAEKKQHDPLLQETVRNLGKQTKDVPQEFEKLQKDPHEAVALLVMELHPIVRKTYYPDHRTADSEHIICCLRALHYLTGITFSAKTNLKLNDDEKQFLDFKTQMHDANPDHKIHFFGVWMSRDAEFVAPTDAQRSIIDQWKKWQHNSGGTFQYIPTRKPADAMADWYWYG
jgi:hypothetical protein